MKKKLLFLIPMLIVGVLLFMLRSTGLKAHIAISVIGLVLLMAYTILTKGEWENKKLEISFRLCYGIALVTGVIVMNLYGIAFISILHKISAVLFVILLIFTEIHKLIKK